MPDQTTTYKQYHGGTFRQKPNYKKHRNNQQNPKPNN